MKKFLKKSEARNSFEIACKKARKKEKISIFINNATIVAMWVFIVGGIVAVIASVMVLSYKQYRSDENLSPENTGWQMERIAYSHAPGEAHSFDLYYDIQTKIVWIADETSEGGSITPYVGENGKYCRYIDGNIVEVNGADPARDGWRGY